MIIIGSAKHWFYVKFTGNHENVLSRQSSGNVKLDVCHCVVMSPSPIYL